MNTYVVDYVTFTIEYPFNTFTVDSRIFEYINHLVSISCGYFKFKDFVKANFGRNHFNCMYKYLDQNEIVILGSDTNMKLERFLMVSITGQGCKALGFELLFKILSDVQNYSHRCTRLDLAYDDFNRSIPLDLIYTAFDRFLNGDKIIVSRYRKENVGIFNGVCDNVIYRNITFGKRGGSQFMRLYDKRSEQLLKGLSCCYDYWYRFELELRSQCSDTAFSMLFSNDLSFVWTSFINRMFRILEYVPRNKRELVNAGDIPTAQWWLNFLHYAEKAVVIWNKPDNTKTLEKIKSRVEKVSAELFLFKCLYPSEFDFIVDVLGRNKVRINSAYRQFEWLLGEYDGNVVADEDIEELLEICEQVEI